MPRKKAVLPATAPELLAAAPDILAAIGAAIPEPAQSTLADIATRAVNLETDQVALQTVILELSDGRQAVFFGEVTVFPAEIAAGVVVTNVMFSAPTVVPIGKALAVFLADRT